MKKNVRPVTKHTNIRRMQVMSGIFVVLILCIVSGIWATQTHLFRNSTGKETLAAGSQSEQTTLSEVTVLTSAGLTASAAVSSEAPTAVTPDETAVTPTESAAVTPEPTKAATATPTPKPTASPSKQPDGNAPDLTGYIVVLDPGHQMHPDSGQESIGPGMTGTKDKCSSGTAGVSTGRPEYEVNLEIGLVMRDYLQSLGCTVYMTRTTNDVDISNIERANIALSYSPDAYIRLHCNGSDNPDVRGSSVYVADTGKFKDSLVGWGDLLGSCLSAATDTKYRGCYAGSTYSGLNWATDIPSFLLEIGFMSNATDDKLLSDPDFQLKISEGVADFVAQMPQN